MGQPPVNFAATDPPESVSPRLFQNRRLWLRLATYRPLLIVGGFWVVLLAIALVAYGRLTATGTQSVSQPRELYPHERDQLEQAQIDREVLQTSPATASPQPRASTPEVQLATEPTPDSEVQSAVTIFPGWSLGFLVVLCAGGCLALSQQLNASPKPKRKRKPKAAPLTVSPLQAQAPTPVKPTPQPGPKRMQPYRPAPGASGFAPVPQPERPSAAATVAVVPEAQTHTLDWPKDSLVNAMDVRQRHSVSSWLSS